MRAGIEGRNGAEPFSRMLTVPKDPKASVVNSGVVPEASNRPTRKVVPEVEVPFGVVMAGPD